MKIYQAIELGKAIERYNKRFEEHMHLDFHEVVSLMLEPEEEVEDAIKEIYKRIEMRKAALKLYMRNYIDKDVFEKIVSSL